MSKRFVNIMKETTARWAETITSTAEPDVAGATKLLTKALGHKPRIFTARSPVEFYLAQAVLRGRIAKKAAQKIAEKFAINDEFIKPLTRVGAPVPLMYRAHSWSRPGETTNMMLAALERHFVTQAIASPASGASAMGMGSQLVVRLQSLTDLYRLVMPIRRSDTPKDAADDLQHLDWRINFNNAQKHITLSCYSLYDAVSGRVHDILAGAHDAAAHRFDALQTEMIFKAIGCKDPASIWPYEIFHYVPAFMQFNDAYLLLSGKPSFHTDSEQNLHSATGPAVVWPDGKKNWYFEGHYLGQFGEQIVIAPELMTKEMIYSIENEEERRVAIDRMGWNKYLSAIGAKVAHNRENWVDNTFEVLIDPPPSPAHHGRSWANAEPLRMVLSCRSTGRKYFIAVPREVDHPDVPGRIGFLSEEDRKKYPNIKIKTCEDAQKWLADGANTKHLDYAKHAINVVGAS
jgi:hypothetical protein